RGVVSGSVGWRAARLALGTASDSLLRFLRLSRLLSLSRVWLLRPVPRLCDCDPVSNFPARSAFPPERVARVARAESTGRLALALESVGPIALRHSRLRL